MNIQELQEITYRANQKWAQKWFTKHRAKIERKMSKAAKKGDNYIKFYVNDFFYICPSKERVKVLYDILLDNYKRYRIDMHPLYDQITISW